jgi:ankyrin repeat protein
LPQAYYDEGSSALTHAAARGHRNVLKLLLAAGANVSLADADGRTALVHAASGARGATGSAALLLLHGANPDERIADFTPSGSSVSLLEAALGVWENAQLAQLLVEAGASVDAAGDGDPPLLLASRAGVTWLVRLLLEKGASAHAASAGGETALMAAAMRGDVASTRLLLAAGEPDDVAAIVDATDASGSSSLHRAARRGDVAVVGELLAAHASVVARDAHGVTALMEAFDGLQNAAQRVGDALHDHGAGVANAEQLGDQLLVRTGVAHVEVMEMLLALGAPSQLVDNEGGHQDGAIVVETHREFARNVAAEHAAEHDGVHDDGAQHDVEETKEEL